jgi:amino acid transporter
MNFYWIYNLPTWQLYLMIIAFFVGFALIGPFLISDRIERKFGLSYSQNEIVTAYLSLVGAFFGITLGLIAVGTYENFNKVEAIVNDESSALAALYRNVNMLDYPKKTELETTLKTYTHYVIEQAWPSQHKAIIPKNGTKLVDSFQNQISNIKLITEKDKILYGSIIGQFNDFVEKRRLRLISVNTKLSPTIYFVLLICSLVTIIFTWFIYMENKKLEFVVHILTGVLLGSLVFMIVAMDNPYRGQYSVSSESFQMLLDGLMK